MGCCNVSFLHSVWGIFGTWKPAPDNIELFLCIAAPLAIIAGFRCMRGGTEKTLKALPRRFGEIF